jgi:23S rRNA pseudouridine2605 synthase
MTDTASNRLNKHLALQRGISRREADELIERGRVAINGEVATLGARFRDGDEIAVNGIPLTGSTAYVYLLFNKPIGYVCSRKPQGDNPTIYEILPKEYHTLKPVGRLDKDSSGLILLSNDGDFAYHMTHPKFNKVKIYSVLLKQELAPLHQQMISDHGVTLEDGVSKLMLQRISDDNRKEWTVTMSEGRNRQIRRTFGSLGYDVAKLHRTQFGNYSLGDMKSGQYETVDMR